MNEEPNEENDNKLQTAELLRELDEEKQRSQDYLNRLKYAQADVENIKKRYERQLEETRKYSTEALVMKILDVLDELELALKHGQGTENAEALTQGVRMTAKKLQKILREEGVSPIDALGKPFDPTKHVAVARIETNDADDCMVIEEVRKGYVMREKVIRPSIVKVTAKSSSNPENEGCVKNE